MAPGEGGYRQINKALNICVFEDYLESQQRCLPTLLDVDELSPRVIRILGQNPGKVSSISLSLSNSSWDETGLIYSNSSLYKEQTHSS